MSTHTAALYFRKDAFDTSGKRLLGRQAAGEGFLKALVQHGQSDELYCYAPSRADFQEFCRLAQPHARKNRRLHWLDEHHPPSLARAGALFRPDVVLGELAFQRRSIDPRAYSIVGVTHTIAARHPQRAIVDLLTSPVERWDALVCTSQSVKKTVKELLSGYGDYLEQRCGSRPALEISLPVIPLGVSSSDFPHGAAAEAARASLRQKLEIAAEDVALLFMGRLIFYAKAHPVPMFLAAERAARDSGKRLTLLMTGWFENDREAEDFKAAAATFCPSVRTLFLDGRDAEVRKNVWAASDVFISLSDNVQETFGLTPIEAMANGLPVVVSDWDGYRESVRDGIEGLRIPTLLPPPGAARDLASLYGVETVEYPGYIANLSLATAVDVDACAKAIARLASDSLLRRQLGENGRQRARSTYDWSVVVRAYEELWGQLAELRAATAARFPLKEAQQNPLMPDPFQLYGHYPSRALAGSDRVSLGGNPELASRVSSSPMLRYGASFRAPAELTERLLERLRAGESLTVSALVADEPRESWSLVLRSLLFLAKLDVVRIGEGVKP